MCKKLVAILIGCAMLSSVAMTGCVSIDINKNNQDNSATQESTENAENIENIENTESIEITEQPTADTTTEATEVAPTEATEDVIPEEEGTFVYVDETVTNPTAAPVDIPENDESITILTDVTPESLAGTWKPLVATSVADGTEVPFGMIFGSSYSQYGGSLVIAEDGSFTISMGAAIIEAKSKGTFTMSQNNMLVTYSDDSVDTYLYIPQYRNHEVIKTQINQHYVYFYKEA